ncbi:PqqD family peptide modification chaperone [Streptomyces hydrogenans]|uniref:PqqD family peptide modification chaperone n=1 Tax=Streptomyces hydrogenans TaxID=1873719 RepID=UPI0036CCC96D
MWQLCEHAHPVLTDEGGAILDEHTGRWQYLSPTSSAAVLLLLAGPGREQAVERYAARYSIGRERAAADVGEVAGSLVRLGLAHDGVPEPTRRRWWSR